MTCHPATRVARYRYRLPPLVDHHEDPIVAIATSVGIMTVAHVLLDVPTIGEGKVGLAKLGEAADDRALPSSVVPLFHHRPSVGITAAIAVISQALLTSIEKTGNAAHGQQQHSRQLEALRGGTNREKPRHVMVFEAGDQRGGCSVVGWIRRASRSEGCPI